MLLAHDPHEDVAVEGDVFEVEFLFVVFLAGEGGLELAFAAGAEALDLDLLGEIHVVAAQELEDGFLGAPVDGELLVALVVLQVVD